MVFSMVYSQAVIYVKYIINNIWCCIKRCDLSMIYHKACSRKPVMYLFLCFSCDGPARPGRASVPIPATSVLSYTQLSQFWLPLQSCTNFKLTFAVISESRHSLQAAPDQFKFSLVTSVWIHIWVGLRALSIVLSKSRYMTIPSQ